MTTPLPTHDHLAEFTESSVYVRPDRYESPLQRIQRNALPLIKGLARFRLNPFHHGVVGKMVRIRGGLRFRSRGNVVIGNRVSFWGRQVPVSINVVKDATLTIGDRVFFNYGADVGCYHSITIGNDVLIGPLTNLLDDPLHELEPGEPARPSPIVIEDNVWIARNCTIQPGVTIGRNSVVASGSVVTKDVPANSLVAGVPAKVLRELSVPDGWKRH